MKIIQQNRKSIGFIFIVLFFLITLFLIVGLFIISQITFNKHINDVVDIQTDEISRQIVYNYETYTDSIIHTSKQLEEQLINTDVLNEEESIKVFLNHALLLNDFIKNIALYDLSGNLIIYAQTTESTNVVNEDWFIEAQNDLTTYYFSKPLINEDYKYHIILSKFVPINKYQSNVVIRMDIDFSHLVDVTNKANLGIYGHATIVSNDYDIIYSSRLNSSISQTEELNLFKNVILGNTKTKINNYLMMLNIETITNTPWKIGVFINIEASERVGSEFIFSLFTFSIIFLTSSSLIYLYLAKKITRPLTALENKMYTIESTKDYIVEPIELNFPREVGSLANAFNILMKRMDELVNEVIKEKNEQRKSELRALQNQINPHFLYNTLDSIVWMVENNQNEEAVKMIVSLSRLFKISISGGQNLIKVKDELEHAKHYLFIQSIRYKDKFKYEIIVEDESILKETTLKLILQPLIENAIYHGIDKTIESGLISIKVKAIDDFISFSVTDNGYGLSQDKIDALYKRLDNNDLSDGVGIKNIYQRLKIYFKDEASLIITSIPDEGTTIELRLPKEMKK